MDYEPTKCTYDQSLDHYSTFFKVLVLTIWVASIPFVIPLLMVLFLKVTGILRNELPWPWQLFQKGAWRGTCPVCGDHVYFTEPTDRKRSSVLPFFKGKPQMKEIHGLSCDCGANFHLKDGSHLVYDRR